MVQNFNSNVSSVQAPGGSSHVPDVHSQLWSLNTSLLLMGVVLSLAEGTLMLWEGCPVALLWPEIVILVWCLGVSGLLLLLLVHRRRSGHLVYLSAWVGIALQLLVLALAGHSGDFSARD